MESKIDNLVRTVDDLKRQLQIIQTSVIAQQAIIDKIATDLGTKDSKVLSDVIYKMDAYMSRGNEDNEQTLREAVETRKMVTNIELLVKEVMKGMSIIYNNVDELEENLLPERLTK